MKIKITNLIIIPLLLLTIILFFSFPSDIIASVTFSISIWKDNLIPSLFPFFMVSELLINYGFIELMGESLKGFMTKVFHLPGEASFVLIGSLISGFPSSSKYINELLINNQINEKQASYLLKFNHFSNPLFVIGTVGTLLLNNKEIGILILIVHILTNFIIAFIYRPKKENLIDEKSSFKKGISKMYKKIANSTSFSEVLSTSIFKTFKTLLLLLGIITTFLIVNALLIRIFNLSSYSSGIISGLIEMSGGVKNIALLDLDMPIKASIITFFISFGGFSVHMQVMSILADTNIKYFPYFIARIIHGIISSSIIFIILNHLG